MQAGRTCQPEQQYRNLGWQREALAARRNQATRNYAKGIEKHFGLVLEISVLEETALPEPLPADLHYKVFWEILGRNNCFQLNDKWPQGNQRQLEKLALLQAILIAVEDFLRMLNVATLDGLLFSHPTSGSQSR
jgi:hypothetical protein